MESNLLSAIIVLIGSIVGLVVTNLIAIYENKKGRYISVVTNQTIEHKEMVFKNAAKILALTHPLLVYDPCEDDLLRLKKKLLIACSEFEIHMIPVYTEAFDQITAMRYLVKIFFKCLKERKDNTADIKILSEAHTKFRELMTSFDSANWEYIQLQSDGKNKGGEIFKDLYEKRKKAFDENKNKLKEWTDDNA
jgi:hypothetical protein